MAYLDIPDLWMVVRLAMALTSFSMARIVNFLLAGILIGDLAAVPSHGAEEDVTLGHQGWMIRLLEGIQWRWSSPSLFGLLIHVLVQGGDGGR